MTSSKRSTTRDSSNIWLLVSLLVLFFFVYQISFILSVVVLHCVPLEQLWRPEASLFESPFRLFLLVFLLFGVWMVVEIIAAHLNKAVDRWFCSWVGLLVIGCVFAVVLTFRAHWEYYEVEWGSRTVPELTFQLTPMGSERSIDRWQEFLASKQCESSRLKRQTTDAEWEALREEFIRKGGTFD